VIEEKDMSSMRFAIVGVGCVRRVAEAIGVRFRGRAVVKSVVKGTFNVAENVFGGLHVEDGRVREILGEFGDCESQIRSSIGWEISD